MTDYVLTAIDLAHPEHHASILGKTVAIANMEGATVAVVTVIPDFGMSIVGSFFEEGAEQKALKNAAESLHDIVAGILGETADAEIKHIVRHGTAYEQILETAEMLEATLIVMGAHRPNFQDYLIGPNAARVVRHSKCSVLVLRD
jgi:universal stress protein F